jgi:Domain of unknown function (DUF4331)
MRKIWLGSATAAIVVASPLLLAADHLDGPAASADPAADITDLFAWMSSDAKTVYLVMDVVPLASTASRFSNAVQYVFHTTSRATFGATSFKTVDIICTFDTSQRISCWAEDEYINGDASSTAGISSSSGKLRVFAGLRDDPFFFNLDGFKNAAHTTTVAKGSLTFDAAGCPTGPPEALTTVATQLGTAPDGGTAQDFFKGLNVLAIALAMDKTIVTPGGPILGVWASTNKP